MQKRIRLKHKRLAEELNRGRLSQNGWANRLGLSKSYLSELVNGNRRHPSRSTRETLLRVLNLELDDLFEVEWDETRADRPRAAGRIIDSTGFGLRFRIDRVAQPAAESGQNVLDNLRNDTRFAFRTLRREPLFAVVALTTLALGIAVNIAAFSVVNGVLLRALPLKNPGELVVLDQGQFFSNRDLLEISANTSTLSGVAGMSPGWTVALIEEANSVQVRAARVSSNFFRTLGVSFSLGRGFTDEESIPGRDLVVVLGHQLWQDRYGSDPSILNREIEIDGEKRRIVGVLAAGFEVLQPGTDIFMTLPLDATAWYHSSGVSWLLARLVEGSNIQRAQQEFNQLLMGIREQFSLPEEYRRGAQIADLREAQIINFRPTLLAIFAASLMVLTMAALNLAHLIPDPPQPAAARAGFAASSGSRPSKIKWTIADGDRGVGNHGSGPWSSPLTPGYPAIPSAIAGRSAPSLRSRT